MRRILASILLSSVVAYGCLRPTDVELKGSGKSDPVWDDPQNDNYVTDGMSTTWTHYHVYIDSSFTYQEVIDIRNALTSWSDVVPVYFTVDVVVNAPSQCPKLGTVCIAPTTQVQYENILPDGGTEAADAGFLILGSEGGISSYGQANITINVTADSMGDGWWTAIILHEMGHAMGLSHIPSNICAIMNPAMHCTSTLQIPDIDEWWSIRTSFSQSDAGTFEANPDAGLIPPT